MSEERPSWWCPAYDDPNLAEGKLVSVQGVVTARAVNAGGAQMVTLEWETEVRARGGGALFAMVPADACRPRGEPVSASQGAIASTVDVEIEDGLVVLSKSRMARALAEVRAMALVDCAELFVPRVRYDGSVVIARIRELGKQASEPTRSAEEDTNMRATGEKPDSVGRLSGMAGSCPDENESAERTLEGTCTPSELGGSRSSPADRGSEESAPARVRCWRCKRDVLEEATVCHAGVGTQCKDSAACRAHASGKPEGCTCPFHDGAHKLSCGVHQRVILPATVGDDGKVRVELPRRSPEPLSKDGAPNFLSAGANESILSEPCVHGAWNPDASCAMCDAPKTAPWYRGALADPAVPIDPARLKARLDDAALRGDWQKIDAIRHELEGRIQ